MRTEDIHVAVIGAGPAGLAAIKSLMEEGFQVTGFERRPDVGGLWAFSENPRFTSTTSKTKAQLSKFVTPFTDYPMPDDFPVYPKSTDLDAYYKAYAAHFRLLDKIVFNATVHSVSRTDDGEKWALSLEGEQHPRLFDKVISASGSEVTAIMPEIEGLELFEGQFLHSQAYKRPEPFEGQNVVVVGQGNTAGDCAVELSSSSKVYWSHRRGAMIIPRVVNGARFDSFASWKKTRWAFWVGKKWPSVNRWMFDAFFSWVVNSAWGKLDAGWRLDRIHRNSYYGTTVSGIVVNDHLVPALRDAKVTSVVGVRRIVGPRSVELDDGTILEDIDAIIACTGYNNTLGPLQDIVARTRTHPDVLPIPDLYQGIFPLEHASSLAVLNHAIVMESAALCRELAAMAVAQVWAGKSPLPSAAEMQSQVKQRQAWFASTTLETPLPVVEGTTEAHDWLRWVNEAAGTGVYEYLGWTVKGVGFFLREPRLCSAMSWGVNTPHLYRVFETGKRRAWEGARGAIEHANYLSRVDLAAKPKSS